MSYNARTSEQQAAISHCKECEKDLFWSLELGLNVVGIWKPFGERVLNFNSKGMKEERNAFGILFISIWCPYCNRIQNKEVYTPNWKVLTKEN